MNLLFERKVPTDSRLGVIGLPCHVHGALKMMNTGRYKRYRWHIIFGIFCGGTWTYKALDTYLATKGFRRDDVTRFTFRTGGWPGNIEFETTDGQIFSEARHNPALVERVNRASIFSANSFFTPHRCLTCSDGLADLADISFGDPWLKSEREDRVGKTLVITRSSKGLALLKDALSAGLVECTPLEPDLAVVSQKGMLTFKQNYLAFNRVIGLLRGRRTPKYRYSWSDRASVPWSLHVYTLTAYLNYLVGRHINVRWLRIPLSILQGLTARIIKQYFVRLTTRDGENYFS
jgi:coenzyme F420 hydrogenase subunit beta